MLTARSLYAVSRAETKAMDTTALRQNFHAEDLFHDGEIRLVHTHFDRIIVGGAVPDGGTLVLDHVAACGTASILDRRGMGSLNMGSPAEVGGDGKTNLLGRGR